MTRSVLLVFLLLSGGTGIAALLVATRKDLPRREVAALPPVVESVVVSREDVFEWFIGYGSAAADRSAQIAAEVSATVVELVGEVEPGCGVERGQKLIVLDGREYRHSLERARALAAAEQATIDELMAESRSLEDLRATAERELRVAADEKRRVADLFERDQAAKKEFDFANLSYQQARRTVQAYDLELAKIGPRLERARAAKQARDAEASLTELNMDRCAVVAPFSGIVESLLVDVGDRVGIGTPILSLIDPLEVEVPVQLPASVYPRVAVGAPCELRCESVPDVVWCGRVARIAPAVDEQTRTFSAFLEVDNRRQEKPLVPGTFLTARVRGQSIVGGILVPRVALRDGHVFVARGGEARLSQVRVQQLIGERAVIEGDVLEGDHVIVSHLSQMEDGAPVRVHAAATTGGAEQGTLPNGNPGGLGGSGPWPQASGTTDPGELPKAMRSQQSGETP